MEVVFDMLVEHKGVIISFPYPYPQPISVMMTWMNLMMKLIWWLLQLILTVMTMFH